MNMKAPWTHLALLAETTVPWVLLALNMVHDVSEKQHKTQQGTAVMFSDLLPVLTTGALLVATAASAIYAGAYRSIKGPDHRPEDVPPAMTKSDAMRFPLVGSVVLVSLFLAIKFLPKQMLTLCLGLYFVLLGTIAITVSLSKRRLLAPLLHPVMFIPTLLCCAGHCATLCGSALSKVY